MYSILLICQPILSALVPGESRASCIRPDAPCRWADSDSATASVRPVLGPRFGTTCPRKCGRPALRPFGERLDGVSEILVYRLRGSPGLLPLRHGGGTPGL